MTNVKLFWVKAHVEKLSVFGGQITEENIDEYIQNEKTVQTTLTRRGIKSVELHDRKEKFHILIPGVGWGDAWGYSSQEDVF